jgi:hypothetical protein
MDFMAASTVKSVLWTDDGPLGEYRHRSHAGPLYGSPTMQPKSARSATPQVGRIIID